MEMVNAMHECNATAGYLGMMKKQNPNGIRRYVYE